MGAVGPDIGVGCTRTSATEIPSVCDMMHMAGDPAGSMRPPVVAVKGTTAFQYGGVEANNFRVTCNVKRRDLGSVAREIEQKVRANVTFPTEYHPEFLGEYAEAQASRQRILFMSGVAISAILLVLYVDFQSWRRVVLMMFTLPMTLLGGVLGVLLVDRVISLGSLVGFVTILGIAARNAIMLVSHYRHLETEEGVPFGPSLVLRGAEERLAPIMMTALTAGLALVPLVVTGNIPGQEIEYPMAFVILAGLVTSTLLNLFVLPPAYAVFGHERPTA